MALDICRVCTIQTDGKYSEGFTHRAFLERATDIQDAGKIINELLNNPKIKEAKYRVIAYTLDPQICYCDDGGLEGGGEKLLVLLQKLHLLNTVFLVCFWGVQNVTTRWDLGNLYRTLITDAKEAALIYNQCSQASKQTASTSISKSACAHTNLELSREINCKKFRPSFSTFTQRKNLLTMKLNKLTGGPNKNEDYKVPEKLYYEYREEDINKLTPADIIFLKDNRKHPLLKKLLYLLCLLKGRSQNSQGIQSLLHPLTFKHEIIRTNPSKLLQEKKQKAKQIVSLFQESLSKIGAIFPVAKGLYQWILYVISVPSEKRKVNFNITDLQAPRTITRISKPLINQTESENQIFTPISIFNNFRKYRPTKLTPLKQIFHNLFIQKQSNIY